MEQANNIPSFQSIFDKAEERQGGYEELLSTLPVLLSDAELIRLSDAHYLERLTACIFVSGFSKKVIQAKWDGFMEVFHEFDNQVLAEMPDEEWQAMRENTRIIRNAKKIQAVRDNNKMIIDASQEHDGFGKFIVNWGASDQIGLMKYLNKNGSQIGDNTAQYFLRYVGIDGFIMSGDVVNAAAEAGLPIASREKMRGQKPVSQKDRRLLQEAMNVWHQETQLPYTHLSKIMAYSVG